MVPRRDKGDRLRVRLKGSQMRRGVSMVLTKDAPRVGMDPLLIGIV